MSAHEISPFSETPIEPAVKQVAREMGLDFCNNECSVREILRTRGMVCSFMVREALLEETVMPLTGSALLEVSANNWLHCIDEVRFGRRPIILVDKDQNSYHDIADYLS